MRYSSPVSDAAYLYKNAKTKILLHTHTHTHTYTNKQNKKTKQNKNKTCIQKNRRLMIEAVVKMTK